MMEWHDLLVRCDTSKDLKRILALIQDEDADKDYIAPFFGFLSWKSSWWLVLESYGSLQFLKHLPNKDVYLLDNMKTIVKGQIRGANYKLTKLEIYERYGEGQIEAFSKMILSDSSAPD